MSDGFTNDEKHIVYQYALASASRNGPDALSSDQIDALRKQSVAAFHSLLLRSNQLPYGSIHFEFMREVDSQVPDLLLRHRYRHQIAEGRV